MAKKKKKRMTRSRTLKTPPRAKKVGVLMRKRKTYITWAIKAKRKKRK